jgi:hypothetical protein
MAQPRPEEKVRFSEDSKQRIGRGQRLIYVQTQPMAQDTADEAVTVLYRAHALRLTRLAYVMVGDRGLAEDIVQEAFAGLHRRWGRLSDPAKAVFYLRSSVLNGCRTVLRRAGSAPPRRLARVRSRACGVGPAMAGQRHTLACRVTPKGAGAGRPR